MTRTGLRIDTSDPRPIWRQIEEGIVQAVATGRFRGGEVIPSVRDLAKQLRVNPNTVVKAYQRLAELGVLEVRRGEGTFVLGPPEALSPRERTRALADAASRFVGQATSQGASSSEIRDALEAALETIATPERKR